MSTQDFLNTNLNGKTIVFTGGTDGMGKTAVEKLAKTGAEIMLLGRSTFKSYTQAKLAMNMVIRKLSKELEGTGVTINTLNPGFIRTNLLRNLTGCEAIADIPYMFFFGSNPEVGADRILRVAFSFHNRIASILGKPMRNG